MKKITILFGANGSGKTALAEKIKKDLGLNHIEWKKLFIKNKFDFGYFNAQLESSDSDWLILDGFCEDESKIQQLQDFFIANDIEIDSIAKLNLDLKAYLQHRRKSDKSLDDESFISDYDYYINNLIPVCKKLTKNVRFVYELDARDTVVKFFADFVSQNARKQTSIYSLYDRVAETVLTTEFGEFKLLAYQHKVNYSVHLVLSLGDLDGKRKVPVRVHSSCITGDIFHSKHCDCVEQLHHGLQYISNQGSGMLIYLFQEGRGINIVNKIKAYALQRNGRDTVQANTDLGMPPELRVYDSVKDIVDDLNIVSINLLTNNPDKISKLQNEGVIVEERIPVLIDANLMNKSYLKTKKEKMGHLL